MEQKNQDEKTKTIMDFSKQREETSKKEYYSDKIECWWHNQSSKAKSYIVGACILTIGLGTWLGPCGGWNYVTSPFKKKIVSLTGEKVKLANEKVKIETSYSKDKKSFAEEKSLLEKKVKALEMERNNIRSEMDKAIYGNQNLLERINADYNSSKIYNSYFGVVNDRVELKTAAISKTDMNIINKEYKKDFDDAYKLYNITYCGARHIINDNLKNILNERWTPYENRFISGELDIWINGEKLIIGEWEKFDTIMSPKSAVSLNKSDLKELRKFIEKY
jgi:hypothetical protein